MAVFMDGLLKMSMRGIVIILIVMVFRFLLNKLRVGHRYIVGSWAMVFLFFIIPWKVSLPMGFWGNTAVLDEMWIGAERGMTEDFSGLGNGSGHGNEEDIAGKTDGGNVYGAGSHADDMADSDTGDPMGNVGNKGTQVGMADMGADNSNSTIVDYPATQPYGIAGVAATAPDALDHGDGAAPDGAWKDRLSHEKNMGILACLWLAGLCACIGHMLYSYLALKRKLVLSIPYRDNILWAENIDMPIVFGLIRPKVYLPFSLEDENLSYVILHEEMHVRRKDGLLKMAAYAICLVHWFNPFIWIAYSLLGSDLEKACDEEVIRDLGKENRKEYAYALIHVANRGRKKKRKVFVAPIGFAEGSLKSRVKNVMRYKYTLPGLGAAAIVVIVALSALFMTEAEGPAETLMGQNGDPEASGGAEGNGEQGHQAENGLDENGEQGYQAENAPSGNEKQENTDAADNAEDLPAFFVQDIDSLAVKEPFSIEDCYITNLWIVDEHYYIDEDGVFWGTGRNDYGQLGTGTYGFEEYHEEPVKIAEHVVSMDVSENSYFCIYLTDTGELYGVGSNCGGILLGKGSEVPRYSVENYQKVTKPVLLMTDVAYARAGRENIVALKTDGSAYWWGQYSSTTLSHVPYFEDFWSLDEDVVNPAKMYASEPRKIMDDCVYIATGTHTGAAINEAGELYAWGLNLFGQCGVPVTEDDYIREPVKVMDDVKMVWMESIAFNDSDAKPYWRARESSRYTYHVFLLTQDNTLMAAGLDLGDKEKVTELTGDLPETHTHQYGDTFVPIRVVTYSSERNLQALRGLEFGMSMEETEKILNAAGQSVFEPRSDMEGACLCAEHSQYMCFFDDQHRLESILIQEGGSRDGRFTLDMPFSELRDLVEGAGGELTEGFVERFNDTFYIYEDMEQHIKYGFSVYEDTLSTVWESAI
ncbi:MAG: hypothetical protein NC331_03570 [Lachnospiraceae bacterium]|nr:hypothetical protein [Lachnospiraceae bacterium]MCM1215686.1 hypothetical protein [Lachnospiraceae bacterium]MCM1238447.1 hypothetical protein [Lachnospiraceae bacterium]